MKDCDHETKKKRSTKEGRIYQTEHFLVLRTCASGIYVEEENSCVTIELQYVMFKITVEIPLD